MSTPVCALALAAGLLLAAAPTAPAGTTGAQAAPLSVRPGRFRLVDMREAAGGIELGTDGRFQFGFTYGALDEFGEGRWRVDGGRVLLSTEPRYVDPEFILTSKGTTREAPFRVRVNAPDGTPLGWPVDLALQLADGKSVTSYTQPYGYLADVEPGNPPVSLRLGFRMIDYISAPFAVDVARANDLTYTLKPGSLGQPRFIDQPVTVDGDRLVIDYRGMKLTFERAD